MNIYDIALASIIYGFLDITDYLIGDLQEKENGNNFQDDRFSRVYRYLSPSIELLNDDIIQSIFTDETTLYGQIIKNTYDAIEKSDTSSSALLLEPLPGIKKSTDYGIIPGEFIQLNPEDSLPEKNINTKKIEGIRHENLNLFKMRFAIILKQIRNKPKARLDAVLDLSEKHFHSVGSTYSIHIKAKTLAALATAQYQYYLNEKIQYDKDSNSMALIKFDLGDYEKGFLSGKKEYTIARSLKFKVDKGIFCDKICELYEIPKLNIISRSGSNIEIIVPNNQAVHEKFHEENTSFNRWLFENGYPSIEMAFTILPFSLNDIENNNFSTFMDKVARNIATSNPGFGRIHNGDIFKGIEDFEELYIKPSKQKERISEGQNDRLSLELSSIANRNGDYSWIIKSKNDYLEFNSFDGSWAFADMASREHIKANCTKESMKPEDIRIEGLSIENINDFTYQYPDFGAVTTKWQFKPKANFDFDKKLVGAFFARVSCFQCSDMISQISTKIALERFFELNTFRLFQRKYKDMINIYFSNIDGLFAIGRWEVILEFMRDLQLQFYRFSGEKLHLNMGFTISESSLPISKIYDKAKIEYLKALNDKNLVQALEPFENNRLFDSLLGDGIKYSNWYSRGLIDRNIIFNLLDSAKDAKSLLTSNSDDSIALDKHLFSSKIARIYGYFWRRGKIDRDVRNWLRKLIYNPQNESRQQYRLRISRLVFPLKYALLSIDKEA
ncbi:MAG: Cas10/Cmr2 second palm domain-containing protein [Candidatus Zixiibacteriota bacterium]